MGQWYRGFKSAFLPFFRSTCITQRPRPFTMGTAEVERVNTTQRLQALRELMAQEKYDVNVLIVPSEDQRATHPVPRLNPIPDFLVPQIPANILPTATNVEHSSRDSVDPQVLLFSHTPLYSSQLGVGCVVVTKEHAYLFTDGRYFLQAGQQLDE